MYLPDSPRTIGYLIVVTVTLGLLAAACSDNDSASDEARTDQTATAGIETSDSGSTDNDNNSEEPATGPDEVTEDDLARFIAATEAALVDTNIEGVVLEAPEIYIAIDQASCARFTQGENLEQIVNDHLSDTAAATDTDDEHLIGAVLGAAVETICPEHAAKL